jgi:hypothetical protein
MEDTVYTKLAKARKAFKNSNVKKSGENKFQGYKYFELSDILNAVTDINESIGLATVETVTTEKATLTVVNATKPEETIVFEVPMSTAELKGCHPVQQLGAAITYIRRYLYQNAYSVSEPDQLDSGKQEMRERKPAPQKFAPPQKKPVDKYIEFVRWVEQLQLKHGNGFITDVLGREGYEDITQVPRDEDKMKSLMLKIQEAVKAVK